MHGIFDSHAHYCDERFSKKHDCDVSALLSDIFANGVERIINVGTNSASNLTSIEMASHYPGMYATAGIHPSDVDLEESLESAVANMRALLDEKEKHKIVAIGECGFDYHWRQDNKEKQAQFFEAQMKLAEEYDMPISIHDREAHGDSFNMVLKYPKVRGVFHCYSGSAEMAKDLVRRGWYISFTGVVTYNNAPVVKEAAAAVPLDRILVETDAPYLAPVPYRGKTNRSDYIAYTIRTLAQIHGISEDEMREKTYENACRLFGLQ